MVGSGILTDGCTPPALIGSGPGGCDTTKERPLQDDGRQKGKFNCPCGVVVDGEGNFIVTVYINHRVWNITSPVPSVRFKGP